MKRHDELGVLTLTDWISGSCIPSEDCSWNAVSFWSRSCNRISETCSVVSLYRIDGIYS